MMCPVVIAYSACDELYSCGKWCYFHGTGNHKQRNKFYSALLLIHDDDDDDDDLCARKKRGRQLEKLYKDGNARNTCNRLIFWHLFCHNQRLYHNKFNCIVFFDSRFDSQTNLLKAMILNKSRVDENKVSLLSGMIWHIFCLFVQLMFWNDLISCFLKQYST